MVVNTWGSVTCSVCLAFLSGLLQPDMVMRCLALKCTHCAHVAQVLLVAVVALHVSEKVGKSVPENETCDTGTVWPAGFVVVVVACWNNPPVGACFVNNCGVRVRR